MASCSSWEDARNQLRKIREEQTRDADRVLQLWGDDELVDNVCKLGDELWVVYEQVVIAALDCQKTKLAHGCIDALKAKFPNSVRVARLEGMYYEAIERFEKADEVYEHILEKDPTNMFVQKRRVAIFKAQNNIPEAVKALNKYLELFMTDFEAWMELCDLYLSQQDYTRASFCMEELIMSNPHNHLYHQKYAEIKYTQGGPEMELARSYFSQAAKLNPSNLRALFGVFLSASSLAAGSSKSSRDRQTNSKLAAWAAQQITELYQTSQPKEQTSETKVLESLEKILESLSVGTNQ